MTLTPRQQAALAAVAAAFNDAHPDDPLTPQEYLDARVADLLESYAVSHSIGLLTPYAFVERFVAEGLYDSIVEHAKTDPNLEGFLDKLRAKKDEVNLSSPNVLAGMQYIQQIGLATSEQAARILAL